LEDKMAKSKGEYYEGTLYTIANYLLWFFLGNLYFVLLNIPLLFAAIILLSNGTNSIFKGYFISGKYYYKLKEN
jgi:hypothetical protein